MEVLERAVYHEEKPPRIRRSPMKVLALGLSRSGTESLRNALSTLGYDHVYHGFDCPPDMETWVRLKRRKFSREQSTSSPGDCKITAEEFDAILGHCEAVTDFPAAAFAPELVRAYPDAKVIMNTRNVDDWFKSVLSTFGWDTPLVRSMSAFVPNAFSARDYWTRQCLFWDFRHFFSGSLEANGKWVYREHVANVKGSVGPERLLEWRLGDGWEPLCKFLDKPVPDEPFPSGNMPAQFLEHTAMIVGRAERTRRRNMYAFASGCVAVLAGISYYLLI